MMWPRPRARARPFTPKLSDSVPPEVNTSSSGRTRRKAATRSRAASTAARASHDRGAKLFVCAYGSRKRRLPLDHADRVTYCGLVVLTDLINATGRFVALN